MGYDSAVQSAGEVQFIRLLPHNLELEWEIRKLENKHSVIG